MATERLRLSNTPRNVATPAGTTDFYVGTDGNLTSEKADGTKGVFRTSFSAADITDGTAIGRSLITASDAAAAREDVSAAPSAIQQPSEVLSRAILFHDSGFGDAESLANGGTRSVVPGPGTLTAGVNGSSLVRYTGRGRGIISNIAGTGGQVTLVRADSQTVAAGLTAMAKITPSSGDGGEVRNEYFGFSSATTALLPRRGAIQITQASGEVFATVKISALESLTDDGTIVAGRGLVRPGEEVALCVHYKAVDHQQYFIQAPKLAGFGADVGGDNWILLGETFTDLTGETVYPMITSQFSGTVQYRDFMVLSDWAPSNDHVSLDYNRADIGTHIPSLAIDPVSGLAVAAWNRSASHVGEGMSALRYSVRLASGAWTDVSDLIAAPTSPAGQCIQSLSIVGGQLYLVYWKNSDGSDGGTLYWRTITINSSTGAATLGTETLLGVDGTTNLAFSPIITLPSGRLFISYHHTANDGVYASYSDDSGATWTEVTVTATASRFEPTLVVESDGAIGCVVRSSGNTAKYYRCADPTSAPGTWSAEVDLKSIPQPSTSGSRMQYCKLSDGTILLAGNDDKTTRRKLTIWEMGDAGVVYGKTLIGDWNPEDDTNGTSIMQYPVMIEDGDGHILFAYSRQPSGGGDLNIAIQIDRLPWVEPVDVFAGGTGKRVGLPFLLPEEVPRAILIAYSTTPTPNMSLGSVHYITLTASTATIQAPANAYPWQEITLVVRQDGTGSRTVSWASAWEFNGTTPTLETAANAENVVKAIFSEQTGKWVVTSFN